MLSRARVVKTFERRCRGAEYYRAAGEFRSNNGEVSSVISNALALLERGVVLFIDHDNPQILHWREYRGTSSYDYFEIS